MLAEGDAAPDFTLPDQNGDPIRLSDLRGETIVLYFYPRAAAALTECSMLPSSVRSRTRGEHGAQARTK